VLEPTLSDANQEKYYSKAKKDGRLDRLPPEFHPVKLSRLESEIYAAFCRLSQQRREHSAISDTDILQHIAINGSGAMQEDDFIGLIRDLDGAYLQAQKKRMDRELEK